jgi:UDP-glucose 4-epimerase
LADAAAAPIVWITGARGFIGRHAGRAFAAAGARVAGLGHGAWAPVEASPWGVAHWLNGDITASNLGQLRRDAGVPDLVVHLAGGSAVGTAIAQPREDFFRTVATTIELLEWIRNESPATRVLAVSSAAVYGAGHDGPIAEDVRTRPFSPYGHHKLMMESLLRSYGATYGLNAVVARAFSVYGEGLTKQLLWDACTRLARGIQVLQLGGTGGEMRDWVHVDDVANALVALGALAHEDVPTFNLGTGLGTPVREVAGRLAAAWAQAAGTPVATLEFSGHSRPGDPFSLVADVRMLRAAGVACTHAVDDGLRRYVAWFRHFQETAA